MRPDRRAHLVGFRHAPLRSSLAIAVIGYAESISVAQSVAEEHRNELRPDQELTALGVSAILSGFFQGSMAAGGASQSAANDRAGARIQGAGVVLAARALGLE